MSKLMGFALLSLFVAVVPASADEHDSPIREASKGWVAAFNAADSEALASFYTSDAMLLPPQSGFVSGPEAIVGFWGPFIESVDGKLEIEELEIHGNVAFAIGRFEIIDEAGAPVDQGKYIEIWRREMGEWKIHRDIWNISKAAPATEE